MRIVHVADFVTDRLGYQELQLAKWNHLHGHEVHVITSNLNPPHKNYSAALEPILGPRSRRKQLGAVAGVYVHELPVRFEYRSRIVMSGLTRQLRELSPDAVLVHGSMSPTTLIAARACSHLNVPIFADNHMEFSVQDRSLRGAWTYRLMRLTMKQFLAPRMDGFYGVAEDCSRFLIDALGAPESKVDLLPLGVDTNVFSFSASARSEFRADLGIPESAVVLMQTGKLTPDKDPITLAKAAARTLSKHPDCWLVLVGGGSTTDMDALRSELAKLRVTERARFVPMVAFADLYRYYSLADVLVYPGGTSLSSLEAAACERVVVMNDLPNSRWRANAGIGLNFREGDSEDLHELLEWIVSNPREREVIGRRAWEAVTESYSYDQVAHTLEAAMRAAVVRTEGMQENGNDHDV